MSDEIATIGPFAETARERVYSLAELYDLVGDWKTTEDWGSRMPPPIEAFLVFLEKKETDHDQA